MSTAGGISSLSQIAGIACLNDSMEWLGAFLIHLEQMRNYAYKRINAMPLVSSSLPKATFLLYIDIRKLSMKSKEFTDYMQEKVKLALIPGGDTFLGVCRKDL